MRESALTEETDVYGAAKGQMRLFERLLAVIPGFRGYKEKEIRRESDRLIRNHLYLKLTKARTDYKTVFQKMSDRRQLDVFTDMDRVAAKFDRAAERVNHASYGYSGFFDVVKVQEAALDRMISFDSKLVDRVSEIAAEVDAFKAEVLKQQFDNASDHTQKLAELLDAFDETFDGREEVIKGAS